MKVGTRIKCYDAEELNQLLEELSEAGYGVMVSDHKQHVITITSIPKQEK